MLLYGADPRLIFDEEDDVRALAVSAAVRLAERAYKNRQTELANMIIRGLGGE